MSVLGEAVKMMDGYVRFSCGVWLVGRQMEISSGMRDWKHALVFLPAGTWHEGEHLCSVAASRGQMGSGVASECREWTDCHLGFALLLAGGCIVALPRFEHDLCWEGRHSKTYICSGPASSRLLWILLPCCSLALSGSLTYLFCLSGCGLLLVLLEGVPRFVSSFLVVRTICICRPSVP